MDIVLILVCNAGYYRDGSACLLCTDNNIKMLAGNEPHCDTDPPCDGVSTVSNENHTACGNRILFFASVLIYFLKKMYNI